MDVSQMIQMLEAERDRLQRGIDALSPLLNGQPKRNTKRGYHRKVSIKPKRVLSAAGRKSLSRAMKARWAKTKRQGQTHLAKAA